MKRLSDKFREVGVDGLKDLGISVKEYDNYYVLNYSQIDSPKQHPLVMECRGTIVFKDSFEIVCLPFRRFFNLYETENTKEIPIEECHAVEKSDGSLIKVWWDPIEGIWQVATRGTAYAEGLVGDWGLTFKELFYKTVGGEDNFQTLANLSLNRVYTHMFELCCLENRVVTPYEDNRVYYLSSRNNLTGDCKVLDIYPTFLSHLGILLPDVKVFANSVSLLENVDNLKGLKEGYVLYFKGQPVCKVKNSLYVKLHYIRGNGLTLKHIVDIVWNSEQGEYLTYFPEDIDILLPYLDAFSRMLKNCEEVLKLSNQISDQKEFALVVKDSPISSIAFKLRKGVPLEETLKEVRGNSRVDILRKYVKEA